MTKKTLSIILIFLTVFSINGLAQKKKKQTKVLITTAYGDIKLALYNETPKHRDNFIKLVQEGFYDGTLFHRVIQTFMIQGGDPDSKNAEAGKMLGNGGPGYTVPAEFDINLIHKKGALAAARIGGVSNPKKASSGSQFYIVQGKKYTKKELEILSTRTGITYTEEQIKAYTTGGGTPQLDMSYTVFGEVIAGFDVIDKIALVTKGIGDRPVEDVAMIIKLETKVLISTSYGDIKLVLYNETPKHRDNFIKLVEEGFYDSLLFHRIMNDLMIQGGDPNSKNAGPKTMLGDGGPGYTIPAEFNSNLIHKKGALAAARMEDDINSEKASSGSQFYIIEGKKYTRKKLNKIKNNIKYTEEQYTVYETEGGAPTLDGNYTVFGEVVEGFDVIDKIAAVAKGRADRPKEDVKMTMKIVKK